MKWMSLNSLRESYLSFFESKGHLRLPSFPLVPLDDKSLLLINAGMTPLKPYFTGEKTPPRRRVTSCQKCVRVIDIDRVGLTARHGTFFEMLGNFSFGDYFKQDALRWAWEFLTEVLEIPQEILWPSVYEQDDEAYAIWRDEIGVPEARLVRLGKSDNFWEHGTGPCGPCSEIYYDRGEKYGCGSPDCRPGCDCDRYVEIWNNVFTQFDSDGKGTYTPLPSPNIDTGMGLERLACVIQGVDGIFEVDTIKRVLERVCEVSGVKYGADNKNDISVRIITDHIRSTVFLVSDGVVPSNEGRGYVLRRLLRRAARHGRLLGIKTPFLHELALNVIEESREAYPELEQRCAYIRKVVKTEEERFSSTIDAGLDILNQMLDKLTSSGVKVLDGSDAFKLYDTFGFPIDLTKEILAEKSIALDEEGFAEQMKAQRERARAARANISGWASDKSSTLTSGYKTEFVGYDKTQDSATVLAILKDGESVDSLGEGEAVVILDKTPFYGEGGGQVGDSGIILGTDGELTVTDTKKTGEGAYLHICAVKSGFVSVGDTVTAEVDKKRRASIQRNHSSAHLLQSALRTVLGEHVAQAGSYVDEGRVRFDFSHTGAMTPEELAQTEALVNEYILAAGEVTTTYTDMNKAREQGATALFGEKYGDVVRVVKMDTFSTELCGGCHVSNTAQIGLFKLISESSVAAGVRRIEGTTGYGVLELLEGANARLSETAKTLKSGNVNDIVQRANAVMDEIKALKSKNEALEAANAASLTEELLKDVVEIKGITLISANLGDVSPDTARNMCGAIKDKYPASVTVLASTAEGKATFCVSCGKDALKAGAHAGNIAKAVASVTGGSGGGRPDSATSGGRDMSKLADALAQVPDIVSGLVK
ncbi:MAG: alanine--tRNA ligase [Eubacteriales bacterium]